MRCSTACSAPPCTTCRGTAIATAPSATLPTGCRPRAARPIVVPYGVSNPLGAVAYASTVAEIAEQCAALGFVPGAIAHCSGSAGTQAGLVVGARVCLPATRIVGIDIDAEPERVRADVLAYGRAAADLLDQPFDEADVEVVAGHAGPAYGVPHDATIEAIRLGARLGGAGARSGLFGQGPGRPDRADPRRTLVDGRRRRLPAYRRRPRPVRLSPSVRLRSDRCSTPKPACCST